MSKARASLPWIAAVALLGLALRIAAARGGYWLDEAWSVVFAREAGTPGRVFFAINHDNNHFLNTLWLQLVGWGASPLLGRALSIACGTATIIVAGLIGSERGPRAAAITALLFALSPILVTYGAEARGYAPMLLALLIAIRIVDRQLFGAPVRNAPVWLGVATLLGMLAHASMLFGIAALTAWVAIEQMKRVTPRRAVRETLSLMGRALAAVVAVLLLVWIGAMASPTGFRMGSLTGFTYSAFLDALAYMLAYAVGWPFVVGLWLTTLLLIAAAPWPIFRLRDRAPFHLIAILGLPLLVALLRPDNSAFPRYYLLSGVALLLLVADLIAIARGAWRWPAYALLAALVAGSLALDARLIDNRRGDPESAIAAMRARAPEGATLLLDSVRDSAVIDVAAATQGYRLRSTPDCGSPRFLFAERDGTAPFPPVAHRCGLVFRPIASGHVDGLSGMDWRLYEAGR